MVMRFAEASEEGRPRGGARMPFDAGITCSAFHVSVFEIIRNSIHGAVNEPSTRHARENFLVWLPGALIPFDVRGDHLSGEPRPLKHY